VKLTPTGDGKGIIFVAHDGEVYPSGFLPISTGKAPEDNLDSIYASNPLFIALRDPSKLRGRCGRCEYRTICGGSRSRAFAEFEDPFEEDPACPYVPMPGQESVLPTGTTALS
jgi:radical SAM protein with 4Fe4S-binding SPASM domain